MSGVKSPQEPLQVGLRVMPSGKRESGAQAKKVNRFPYLITYGASNFADTFFILCTGSRHAYRKAPTRDRADHYETGVTYLQFPIQMCFSFSSLSRSAGQQSALRRTWFPNFTLTFS